MPLLITLLQILKCVEIKQDLVLQKPFRAMPPTSEGIEDWEEPLQSREALEIFQTWRELNLHEISKFGRFATVN